MDSNHLRRATVEIHKLDAFDLPVDSEHKAKSMKILSFRQPHMRSFWLAVIAFFVPFMITFAPAALLPVIRDDLNLTKTDVGNSGIASVCGSILSRVLMGSFVDNYGPRYGISALLLLTAPAVFCTATVSTATGFIVCRLVTGLSLGGFVGSNFWMTSMFSPTVVGGANGLAVGWAHTGGGLAQILLPLLLEGFENVAPAYAAWRYAILVTGALNLLGGAAVLCLGQDMPDGNYSTLKKEGTLKRKHGSGDWRAAAYNYRSWIIAITYGYAFGVELTVDNNITQYFQDQFNLDLQLAGVLGGIFGCLNFVTIPFGGLLSDWVARPFGMRGRLWTLWIMQTLSGVMCLLLGLFSSSLGATLACLLLFGIFNQQSTGLHFGVMPFISKRSTGLVSGFMGAGGNVGSAVTQAIFFTAAPLTTAEGFSYMGIMVIGATTLLFVIYFPMWGGMLMPAKDGVTEEDYYFREYTAEEIAGGLHSASIKFAYESRSQRGNSRNSSRRSSSKGVAVLNTGLVVQPTACELTTIGGLKDGTTQGIIVTDNLPA